jgi:hypothetical protein
MDKNFIIRISDKGISLLVFIFILKELISYDANIIMIFFGSIFGFIISFNQDFSIKNQIINNKIIGSEILLSILFNNLGFIFAFYLLDQSFLNATLFYFASSGRFDILKYESRLVGAQFQSAIALSTSLLSYFIISNFIENAELFSITLYMILKSVIGEIYLASILKHNNIIARPIFDKNLAFSGILVVSIGYVIPTITSYFVQEPSKLLYHIAAIQRALSPAQQFGAIYSKNYTNISDILKHIKFFSIISVITTMIIYIYIMNSSLYVSVLILISIISFYSTMSGSWTIKMIYQGRGNIELLKTVTSIILSFMLIPFLMLASINGAELIIAIYVAYLFFLYVPFIHLYR